MQDYWSGLSFPPPGHLPNRGIEPMSLRSPALADGFFTTSTTSDDNFVLCRMIMQNKQGREQWVRERDIIFKTMLREGLSTDTCLWASQQNPFWLNLHLAYSRSMQPMSILDTQRVCKGSPKKKRDSKVSSSSDEVLPWKWWAVTSWLREQEGFLKGGPIPRENDPLTQELK